MALPPGPKLNIGSGPRTGAGWINIDGSWQAHFAGRSRLSKLAGRLLKREIGEWPAGIVCLDFRRGIPYPAESVSVVYTSHTIEHVYRDQALKFLREAWRVLRSGGVCRVVVPDVASIVRWYLEHQALPAPEKAEPSSDVLMKMLCVRPYEKRRGHFLLRWYRTRKDFDDHKWMYDQEGLLQLFRSAGFREFEARQYLDSRIPAEELQLVEFPSRLQDGAGVCVEGVKT